MDSPRDSHLYLFERCKSYKDRKISMNDFRSVLYSMKLPEHIAESVNIDSQGRVRYDDFAFVYKKYFEDTGERIRTRGGHKPSGTHRGYPDETEQRPDVESVRYKEHRSEGKKSRAGYHEDQYPSLRHKKPTRSVRSHKSEGSLCSDINDNPEPVMPPYDPPTPMVSACKHCAMQARRIKELEEDLEAARTERRRLEDSNDSIRNDFQAYYKKASELAGDNKQLRARLLYMSEYHGDGNISDMQYEELKRSKRHLEEKLAHGENMIMQLQKDIHKLQDEVFRVKKERNRLHSKNRDIEKELWCAQSEAQELSIQLLQEQKKSISSATSSTSRGVDKTSGNQRFNGIGMLRKTIHGVSRCDDELDVRKPSAMPIQRISSAGAELSGTGNSQLEPVRDEVVRPSAKARSHKSVKSEDSDGYGYNEFVIDEKKYMASIFTVLGQEVSIAALPESITEEVRSAMVRSLENCHSVQEVIRLMVSYGCSPVGTKLQGLQVKYEHLQKKLERVYAEYQTLHLCFQETKEMEELWYTRCQQLEANGVYLHSSLHYCQLALETSELLVDVRALPEPQRDRSHYPAHFPAFDTSSISETSSRSPDHMSRRHSLLTRARLLLQTLDSDQDLQDLYSCHSQEPASSSLSTSLHPELSQNTTSGVSGISSLSSVDGELSIEELDRLKTYRQLMQSFISKMDSLVSLEPIARPKVTSPSVGPDAFRVECTSPILELETATHAEELATAREEKAELRSRIYMMEQNQRQLELELSQKQLQNGALQKTISQLNHQVRDEKRKRRSAKSRVNIGKKEESYDNSVSDLASELKERMEYEKELTKQYDDLYGFFSEYVSKSKENHDQLLDFIKDLKFSNNALVEAYEKSKLKQKMEKMRIK